jgi:hypothetical protein
MHMKSALLGLMNHLVIDVPHAEPVQEPQAPTDPPAQTLESVEDLHYSWYDAFIHRIALVLY